MGICADCYGGGLRFDFICGDEVYGSCTKLREFLEAASQAYVLRVASSFMITLAPGTEVTSAEAVKCLVECKRRWEVWSAGRARRVSGGMPGRGSGPPRRVITRWSAAT